MALLKFEDRLRILTILCIGFLHRLSEGLEDTRSRTFLARGFLNSDSRKGDEIQLQTPLGSIYARKNLRGRNASEICGYTIYNDPDSQFKVSDFKRDTGEAKLVLSRELEKRKRNFSIEIAPHACSSGRHLEKMKIFVQVVDSHEWSPEWKQSLYSVEALEGKFYGPLLKVELKDGPGVEGQGRACQYSIEPRSVPFEVDESGAIINTEPLELSKKEKWTFEVKAESCDGRKSAPVKVEVKVKPSCQPEWIGVPEKIEFSPHDGLKLLAPEAELSLCEDSCNVSSAFVSVKLSTGHIGKGCDRDTYSLDSQRKLCGASLDAVDLLPSPTAPNSWTKEARTDDGKEGDEVFAFDGKKDAVEVPEETSQPHLGREFTISTWMKHEQPDELNDGSVSRKENILCISDSEEMNRQHAALFLHRCHLVLLLRQEPGAGLERDAYAPAEWRWTLPEVCDGSWHHYAVSVYDGAKDESVGVEKGNEKVGEEVEEDEEEEEDEGADKEEVGGSEDKKASPPPLPKVRLHVDGKEFVPTHKNPNMVNDFPLHRSKIRSTKMVVGGCWMGGMGRIRNYFKGYLAGLSLLNNQNEPGNVIECLTRCQEKLDLTGVEETETGTTLSLSKDKTSITAGGPGLGHVENILRRIAYVNTRNFPTPGLRPITLDTRATCDNGKQVDVEVVKSLLLVNRIEKPLIVLKGSTHFQEEEERLKEGVAIFRDLDISTHSKSQADEVYQGADGKKPQFMNKYHLDSCNVKVVVPLAPNIELLKVPEDVSGHYKVKVKSSPGGLHISGVDRLENYEKLLTLIKYTNTRPSDLNQRSFSLVCTELNGRYVSNQLDVSMGVIHKVEQKAEPQAAVVHRMSRPVGAIIPSGEDSLLQPRIKQIGSDQSSGSATGVVIVCVVCIGFIVLLAAVGVSRIRNAQRHSRDSGVDDKQEMEWDNSALTITVNPMDQEGLYEDDASQVSALNSNNNNNNSSSLAEEAGQQSNHHHHQHHRHPTGSQHDHHRHHHHPHNHQHHQHDEDDTDVDDDDVSCHDSSCVEEEEDYAEEARGKVKKGELEWDDSTLSY